MAPLLHRAAIKKKKETTGQKYNGPLLHRAAIKKKERRNHRMKI